MQIELFVHLIGNRRDITDDRFEFQFFHTLVSSSVRRRLSMLHSPQEYCAMYSPL